MIRRYPPDSWREAGCWLVPAHQRRPGHRQSVPGKGPRPEIRFAEKLPLSAANCRHWCIRFPAPAKHRLASAAFRKESPPWPAGRDATADRHNSRRQRIRNGSRPLSSVRSQRLSQETTSPPGPPQFQRRRAFPHTGKPVPSLARHVQRARRAVPPASAPPFDAAAAEHAPL